MRELPDFDVYFDGNGCLTERVRFGDRAVVVHYDDIPAQDLTVVHGIPCATALRTVIDIAPDCEHGELERIVRDCLAERYRRIYGSCGISVFAARDRAIDELAQQARLVRFAVLTLVRVGVLRAAGSRLEPTGRNPAHFGSRARPARSNAAGRQQPSTGVVRVVGVDDDGQVHFTILPGPVAKNRRLLDRTIA